MKPSCTMKLRLAITIAVERAQLDAETSWWRRASGGVDRVLRAATQES